MNCILTSSFYLIMMASVYGAIDLSRIPDPQPNFDIHRYLGTWYDQGKVAPCSWAGSREFQDWRLNFIHEGKRLFLVQDWRSGEQCVNVKSQLIERYPGCYTIKDPIGNVYTGEQKIIATDYKRFSLTYGCVKRDVDGKGCADAWLSIETRQRFPDPYTLKIIDLILQKLYGVTLSQTERVLHKQGC